MPDYASDYKKLLMILEKTTYDKIKIYIMRKNIHIQLLDAEFYESLVMYENIEYNQTIEQNNYKKMQAIKYYNNKK